MGRMRGFEFKYHGDADKYHENQRLLINLYAAACRFDGILADEKIPIISGANNPFQMGKYNGTI